MKSKTTLLCLASSFLLWLSFPAFNLGYLAGVGFLPLFFALQDKTKRSAFWLSYFSGFIFFMLVLYWLVHVTLVGLIVLCLYLAFYFAFFGYFFVGFKSRLVDLDLPLIIFLSSIWVVLEYTRSHLFTDFPWALLGYSQYQNIGLIQIADTVGSLGVSFVVIFMNLQIFQIVKLIQAKEFRRISRALLILILPFIIIYTYGFYAINKYSSDSQTVLQVSLLQGNIPQEAKGASIYREKIKQIYFDLTRQSAKKEPDLIIWPESAYPNYFSQRDLFIPNPLKELIREVQGSILFGAVLEQENKYYNGAILFPSELSQPVFYKKIHLVPFGEYLPLRRYLPFLVKFVPIEDFDSGREFVVFETKNKQGQPVSFSVLICFEDTIPELARQFRLRGADFLVNITNDAWFKETSSPYQHLQASIFRALENRVYVLRAANTGITCIIDNCGRVVKKARDKDGQDIFIQGFINGEVKKQDALSFYSRFGDFFFLICSIYMLWYALFPARKKMFKDKKYCPRF
ncbi:apolipoprotein N-acyltransferase [Candidatus Omnitrophota bacterium]